MSDLIAVTHVKQYRSNLCWAACCEMLARRYGARAATQQVFEREHHRIYGHGANVQAGPDECATLLTQLVPGLSPASKQLPGVIEYPVLKRIFSQARLVIGGCAGHDYVLCGWGTSLAGVPYLWAHDPEMDTGPVKLSYERFAASWRTSVIVDDGAHAID